MAQPTPPQEPKDQSQEPKRLGGFELLGRLGKGGMGTVLKARQVSMDRLVALKILPKKLAENEAFVQRFLREARSAARLRHPNIVQAFDVGQADGYYFFAMEYVDGETLADLVRRDGPLEPNRALGVMKEVASALAAAHEAGIVHRDIKPANIMLDKKGEVRVADFGLAKQTEGDVAVTADGAVVGTPAYVAPEMAKGGEADARSDLYSLGATIFCALAGRPPFEGRNFSEVLIKQVNETAPPLASLAPRVDRRLCHIVDRLLRKNPEARYPSANALLEDLNGLGKLQSVAAAARAEGRAMIAEAPTLDMTEGQRTARHIGRVAQPPAAVRDGAHSQESQPRAAVPHEQPKSKTTLIAVGAIVALLAIAGLVLALRSGPKPSATSVPQPPTPTTQHQVSTAKPPEDAKKTSVPKEITPPVRPKVKDTPTPKVEPVPEPKDPAALAKWEAIKADAKKLSDAGKHDEAVKMLRTGQNVAIAGIGDLIDAEIEAVEAARRKAAAAALAAYQAESDKLWALFKARDYPAADKLLAGLPANLVGGTSPSRDLFNADLEAAKLLKEFWTAVERGVLARKGKFVSIAGKGGNVESVANGQVTLKVGAKELTAPLLGMDAAQAAAIADLKDDERGNLAKALFLIADGADADAAGKALAAAGNPPGMAVYKDRLAALTLGAAEVAARRAWAEIEAAAAAKPSKAQAQRLLALLDAFDQKYAKTRCFTQRKKEADDFRQRADEAGGLTSYALEFDGENDFATIPYSDAVSLKEQFTVEARFWLPEAGRVGGVLVSKCCDTGQVGGAFTMHLERDRKIRFSIHMRDPFTWKGITTEEQLEVGRWHHVACQYDGATLRTYLNGKLAAEERIDKALNNDRWPMHIGKDAYHGNFVRGRIAEVRLWNKALSADDIRANMNRPLKGDERGLIGLWACAGGEGDTLKDRSPSGADAQITGARWVTADGKPITTAPRGEAPKAGEWQSLFDGKTLDGWKALEEGWRFDQHGKIDVAAGKINLGAGKYATGIAWTRELPKTDYEVSLEATATGGFGGFIHMLFSIGDARCMFCFGTFDWAWMGLDTVDGKRVTKNPTATRATVEKGRWYLIRLRVTQSNVKAWLDDKEVVNLPTAGRVFDVHIDWAPAKQYPLAIGTWTTDVSLRNIRLRRIEPDAAEAPKPGRQPVPFSGKPLFIEAEESHVRVVPMEVGKDEAASGGQFVWQPGVPGEKGGMQGAVVFRITVRGDCTAYLWGRVIAPTKDSDSFLVGVAPGATNIIERLSNWNLARHAQWEWVSFDANAHPDAKEHTPTPVGLKAGVNTLIVVARETGAKLDRICLTPTPEPPPAEDQAGEWQSLFDGKTLKGWKVAEHNDLKNGEAKVEDGAMVLAARGRLGLAWTGAMPQGDYEVAFDTSLVSGHRLASLLFPVGGGHCDLVLGGISGKLVGLDGVDGKGYRDNPALTQMKFETNHWYAVRVRVAGGKVEVWADGTRLIDLPVAGHTFAVEDQRAAMKPLGLSAYQGTTGVRNVRMRTLAP